MTQLIDYTSSNQQDFLQNLYSNKLSSQRLLSMNRSYSQEYSNVCPSIEQKIQTRKFAQIDQIFSIIMIIKQTNQIVTINFKLLNITKIFRIQSLYLKTFLNAQFLKNQSNIFQRKINSLNGQISLEISFILGGKQYNNIETNIEIQNLLINVKHKESYIKGFWKDILAYSQGKYQFQNNINFICLLNDMKLFTLLSKTQRQTESVYVIKPFLKVQPKVNQNQSIAEYNKTFHQSEQVMDNSKNWQYRKKFQQVLSQKKGLMLNHIKPAKGIRNMQMLSINPKQTMQIFNKLQTTKPQQIIKVTDQQCGKIFLNFTTKQKQDIQKQVQRLSYLDLTHQYSFVNSYFLLKDNQQRAILFKIALKKCSLRDYLLKNVNSISLECKIKIFLQIYFSVQILWQKFGIFPGFLSYQKIQITKNFTIKLDNVDKWQYIHGQFCSMPQYDKYLAKAQTMIRLQNILYQLIFSNQIFTQKPSFKLIPATYVQKDRNSMILKNYISEKNNLVSYYGIPEILKTLIYCFQSYINYHKLVENWKTEEEKTIEINYLTLQIKKGSLDLVLGTLFKSLEIIRCMT